MAVKPLLILASGSLGMLLAVQPVQMLGYGLFFPASVYFANDSVAPADRVQGQSLRTIVAISLSTLLGSLVSGYLLDLGGTTLMLWFSAGCAPVTDGRLYADRAYIDAEWRSHLQTERNVALITPRKRKKYDVLVSEDAVSTRISALRQPIEVFFNWLQAKTHIQSASHVRSCAGLLFHIFSSLAFAALLLRFNY